MRPLACSLSLALLFGCGKVEGGSDGVDSGMLDASADAPVDATPLPTGPDALHLTRPGSFVNSAEGDTSSDGNVVVVADRDSNRVLVWSSVPATSGVEWDLVLGQTAPTDGAAGTSETALNAPDGVWTDGQTLAVADTLNHRVLIWTSFPTTDGEAADLVLGQVNFNTADAPAPPTASSMNEPADVFFDGERLWVSDSQNNRIMVWNGMPTTNNQPADYFVGQAGGETNVANAGAGSQNANAAGINIPGEITVAHGSLFICDRVNARVVIHTPRPEDSGEEADAVLGASDLVGGDLADANQGFLPRGLAVFDDKLYLSDTQEAVGNSRVLRYGLTNLP